MTAGKFFRVYLLLLIILVFPHASSSQVGITPAFKKISEFKTSPVKNVTLDRLGDIYLTLENDSILKYDSMGTFMSAFHDASGNVTTLLEPWNPLRMVRYVRKTQTVELYDRFFEMQDKFSLDPAWAIEPILATPGIANSLWILDQANWSVSLIDTKTKGVIREATLKIPANTHPEFVWMREYQSLLFLIDHNNGVYIYNTVGTLVHTIAVKNIGYIGFLGEEFYYVEGHVLKFYDLYTEEVHSIPVDPQAKFVMVTDVRMIVVKDKIVELREFKE